MILGFILGIYVVGVILLLWLGVEDLYEFVWALLWPMGIVGALVDSVIGVFRK